MTRNQAWMVAVILCLGASSGLIGCSPPAQQVPAPPDLPAELLSNVEANVRRQIGEAYEAARDHPSDPAPSGRTGMILHAYGYLESAASFYRYALARSPDAFRWRYYLGIAQAGAGRNGEAAESFRKALKSRPGDLPARLRLAAILIDLNRVDESLTLLREVVRSQPDNPQAHYEMGRSLAKGDRHEAALVSLSKACQLAPHFGAAHYALALSYRELKDQQMYERHLALFQKYRDDRPPLEDPLYREVAELREGVTVLLERARRLQEEGRDEEAISEYRRVLEIRPEHGMAHASLMGLYRHLGRLAEGDAQYRSVLKVNPNIPEVHYNYGFLLLDNGRLEEARRAFERALELNPSYADAHVNLAVTLVESGDREQALFHLRKALEIDRNHRLGRYNLARLLLEQGQVAEAIELLSGLKQEEKAEMAEVEALLTTACAMDGRWHQAETHARRALDLSHTFGLVDLARLVRIDLGKVLFQLGSYREAIGYLATAAESEDERAAPLLLLLAKCYDRVGDRVQAAQYASAALALARRHGQLELAATIEQALGTAGRNHQ